MSKAWRRFETIVGTVAVVVGVAGLLFTSALFGFGVLALGGFVACCDGADHL